MVCFARGAHARRHAAALSLSRPFRSTACRWTSRYAKYEFVSEDAEILHDRVSYFKVGSCRAPAGLVPSIAFRTFRERDSLDTSKLMGVRKETILGQDQVWRCALCGAHKGNYSFYHGDKDESLYLCVDCLKDVSRSVSRDQLADMTTSQLKRHMEVRDGLASLYRDSFVATRTFCVGKRHNIPVLEVDEERELWALPKAVMPLALSINSIIDIDVALSAEDLNADDEVSAAIVDSLNIKDYLPGLRKLITWLYKSEHTDLAPIPEGHIVDYLYMKITLDDQESGLSCVDINLLPFWHSMPSNVKAGYDCAHDIIEFVKQLKYHSYEGQEALIGAPDLTCNDRLSILAARGQLSDSDTRTLRYYLERIPTGPDAQALGSSYSLVKTVADTVCAHILFGEKAPDWKTQHTTGFETFLGAFYRYAPGLSVDDVVYIMDNTQIQSGKGGILLAQDSFAADDLVPSSKDSGSLNQPIAYEDLLFVGMGTGKGQLVLAYRDGRRIEVNGGKYAHYLFAAINCILFLRVS